MPRQGLQGFVDFFSISLVFNMFLTLALVEVKEYESENNFNLYRFNAK